MLNDIFSGVWLALAVTFVIGSPPALQAQTVAGQAQATRGIKLSPGDRKFLQEAYERGRFEIGAAQLALENSSVFAVRILAQHIAMNREQIDEQLKALAEMKGMAALSEQLDSSHRETLERLQEASDDEDFDLRYCGTVVSGHMRDIKALQSVAARASDPDFKALANAIASNLKEHLAVALAIQRELASARNEVATIDV
jgi:predicted outer membrane protein